MGAGRLVIAHRAIGCCRESLGGWRCGSRRRHCRAYLGPIGGLTPVGARPVIGEQRSAFPMHWRH